MSRFASKILDSHGHLREDVHRDKFIKFRDDLRDKSSGTNFIISDIGVWKPNNDRTGYVFIIKNEQHEVAIINIYEHLNNFREMDFWDDYSLYSFSHEDISLSQYTRSAFHIGYNYKEFSWGMNFDDETSLTYLEGDFYEFGNNINTSSGEQAFIPKKETRFISPIFEDESISSSYDPRQWGGITLVLDDDTSSVFVYSARYNEHYTPYDLMFAGDFIEPELETDTSKHGFGVFKFRQGSSNWNLFEADNNDKGVLWYFDEQNNLLEGTISYPESLFQTHNTSTDNNEFLWKKVLVEEKINSSGDHFKGYIDPSLCRLIGDSGSPIDHNRIFKLTDQNKSLQRIHRSMGFPWVLNRVPFPLDEFDTEIR